MSLESFSILPNYTESKAILSFESETQYQQWFDQIASKHANWLYHTKYEIERNKSFIGAPLITPLKIRCTAYICDHAKRPRAKITPVKRIRTKPSIKIGCTASLYKYLMTDSSVTVKYSWKHPDHNPINLSLIIETWFSPDAKVWIEKYIIPCTDWKVIRYLLRINNTFLSNLTRGNSFFPIEILNKYKMVQNIIQYRLSEVSKKSNNDKESLDLWIAYLNEKGCTALYQTDENHLFISWVAEWQKKCLEEAEEWCIYLSPSFQTNDKKFRLFSIVVRSSITNRGVPVCFLITDRDIIPTLEQWLLWLKQTFQLNVNKIMIDHCPNQVDTIQKVFSEVVIELCHWDMKRAWEKHISTDVKFVGSSSETETQRKAVQFYLDTMLYAPSPQSFDLSHKILCTQLTGNRFITYFNETWLGNRKLWSKGWRPTTIFRTNNMVRTYLDKLETFHSDHSRVDQLIYLLFEAISNDYHQRIIDSSNRKTRLSYAEEEEKTKAYHIDYDLACSMVNQVSDTIYESRSFTEDRIIYYLKYKNGYLSSCSCSNNVEALCKHIFLVSRTTQLPYTSRTTTREQTNDSCEELIASAHKHLDLFYLEYQKVIMQHHDNPNMLKQIENITREACIQMKDLSPINNL